MESVGYHQKCQHTPYGCLKWRRKKGAETIFEEIMAEHIPNLGKTMNLHIQQAQCTPSSISSKRITLRHIIVKLLKDKEKILKAAREVTLSCTKIPIKLTVNFSLERMEVRRQ